MASHRKGVFNNNRTREPRILQLDTGISDTWMKWYQHRIPVRAVLVLYRDADTLCLLPLHLCLKHVMVVDLSTINDKTCTMLSLIFFTIAQQPPPPRGPGASPHQGFTITHRHTTVVRTPLDEGSARRRDLYLTTDTHASGGIRTHKPSRRAAADLRLRPHCHWDRPSVIWRSKTGGEICVPNGVGTENLGLLGCYIKYMSYLFPKPRYYLPPSSSSVEQLLESSALDSDVCQLNNPQDLVHSKCLFVEWMCAIHWFSDLWRGGTTNTHW